MSAGPPRTHSPKKRHAESLHPDPAPRPRRPARHPGARAALGRDRHRRRRHRPGHRSRRRLARLPHAAGRSRGFCQGHLQQGHQAGPWRRALPGPGQYQPGARGPARAWPAGAQRAAPGVAAGLRGAGLPAVRPALLRHRPQGLRHAGRRPQPGRQPLAESPRGAGRGAQPGRARRRASAARRQPVFRRPVRRCAAGGGADAHAVRRGRHRRQLHARDRAEPARRRDQRRDRAGCAGRRHLPPARRLRDQRHRRVGRCDPADGGRPRARHGRAQPGRAPDAAAQLPAGRARHPDPQDRRRPGAVRGAMERPHHYRHHRYAAPRPAAGAGRRCRRRRFHPGNRFALPGQGPDPRRRHQRLGRPAAAGAGHRRGLYRVAVARAYDPGVQGRADHRHRRQVDHLPQDGRRRDRDRDPAPDGARGPVHDRRAAPARRGGAAGRPAAAGFRLAGPLLRQ
ncbi:hypothetical protein D9M72_413820 [compost metagenome]